MRADPLGAAYQIVSNANIKMKALLQRVLNRARVN